MGAASPSRSPSSPCRASCSPTSCAALIDSDLSQPRHDRQHYVPSRRQQDRYARMKHKNPVSRLPWAIHRSQPLACRQKTPAACADGHSESASTCRERLTWGIPVNTDPAPPKGFKRDLPSRHGRLRSHQMLLCRSSFSQRGPVSGKMAKRLRPDRLIRDC